MTARAVISDHRQLEYIGTNTHAQIDTHIASVVNPHTVTLDQAFDAGKVIDGAINEANAVQIGEATDRIKIWHDGDDGYIKNTARDLALETPRYFTFTDGTSLLYLDFTLGHTRWIDDNIMTFVINDYMEFDSTLNPAAAANFIVKNTADSHTKEIFEVLWKSNLLFAVDANGDARVRNQLQDSAGANGVTVAQCKTAYDHSQLHNQAHTDYLKNNANDITTGTLTCSMNNPEFKWLSTDDSNYYGRMFRTAASRILSIANQVYKVGSTGYCLTITDAANMGVTSPSFTADNSNNALTWAGKFHIPITAKSTGEEDLFQSGPVGSTTGHVYLAVNGNSVQMWYTDGSTTFVLSQWVGVWTDAHYDKNTTVVLRVNFATAKADLSLDDVDQAQNSLTTPVFPAAAISRFGSAADSAGYRMAGNLDCLAIYNDIRDAAWITAYHAGGHIVDVTDVLEVGYNCNTGSGTGAVLVDAGYRNRTGTIGSAVTWGTGFTPAPGTVNERLGLRLKDGVAASEGYILEVGDSVNDDGTVCLYGTARVNNAYLYMDNPTNPADNGATLAGGLVFPDASNTVVGLTDWGSGGSPAYFFANMNDFTNFYQGDTSYHQIDINYGIDASVSMFINSTAQSYFYIYPSGTSKYMTLYTDGVSMFLADSGAAKDGLKYLDIDLNVADAAIRPGTDNFIDIGTLAARIKDEWLSGSLYLTDANTRFVANGGDIDVYTAANKTIELQTNVYDDLFLPITNAKHPAANYPTWDSSYDTNLGAYTFAINDYVDLQGTEVLHDYAEGTDLDVHVHIITNGANDGTERKVKYIAYYSWGDNNEVMPAEASVSDEHTIIASEANRTHHYFSLGVITGTNYKIGSIVKVRLKRIAGTGTEPANDPYVEMVGIHYQKNTMGSRQLIVK